MLERAISTILKETLCDDVEELRKRKISDGEFEMAAKIIDVPMKKLKMKWEFSIYPGLFYSGDVTTLKEEVVNW